MEIGFVFRMIWQIRRIRLNLIPKLLQYQNFSGNSPYLYLKSSPSVSVRNEKFEEYF